MNYVNLINDERSSINPALKMALNKFFTKHPDCVDGCILRKGFDGHPYVLIIESSDLHSYLSGEYGWGVHTEFHNTFEHTGWFPEMINSCQVGFYKD